MERTRLEFLQRFDGAVGQTRTAPLTPSLSPRGERERLWPLTGRNDVEQDDLEPLPDEMGGDLRPHRAGAEDHGLPDHAAPV
jgi:hypothetical protein